MTTSPIFACLGVLDELHGITVWCKDVSTDEYTVGGRTFAEILRDVQGHLSTIQTEVSGAPKSVPHSSVEMLGETIGRIERALPKVTTLLTPGSSELSARLDIAHAASRRVQERLAHLHESGERQISASSRAYANRLSSLFYALTRLANRLATIETAPPQA